MRGVDSQINLRDLPQGKKQSASATKTGCQAANKTPDDSMILIALLIDARRDQIVAEGSIISDFAGEGSRSAGASVPTSLLEIAWWPRITQPSNTHKKPLTC